MARVTIEDCIKYVPNRFELIMIARKRVKQLTEYGKEATINDGKQHKPTVTSLKEIAEGNVGKDILDEIEVDPKFNHVAPIKNDFE